MNQEKMVWKKVTVSEAQEITGIDDVRFLDSFEGMVNRLMAREDIGTLYFDCYRYQGRGSAGLQHGKGRGVRKEISRQTD